MLDTHPLNIFVTAAEELNFTRAAQKLHISQPSVSQHIQSLERHLNVTLFERAGRQLSLSDAGMTLVPLAKDIIRQSIHIEETMASLSGEVFGHLKVGCSTTPGKYVLPQLLARFHHQYPRVKVTCQVSPQAKAIEMLCDGDVHFALSSHSHLHTCNDVEFHLFMKDPVVLIAPQENPWAKKQEINPEELLDAIFILREEESGTFATVDDALKTAGLSMKKLDTLLILGNSEAIALAVAEGLGVGFVSSAVVKGMRKGNIVPIKIRGLDICRDIYIGHHTNRLVTAAQTAFWELIQNLEPNAICEANEPLHHQLLQN